MKKTHNPEFGINLNDSPDNLLRQITALLEDSNYPDRHNITALGNLGNRIVPILHEILCSENGHLRLEALKVVKHIADKRSIPILIYLLDDSENGIRWIAAEGLVNIGRSSILPLLKSIRDRKNPTFLYKGAHHVLNSLLYAEEKEQLQSLLLSLDNHHQLSGIAPALAFKALETVFKHNA
jgi:HEAT repeat protein